MQPIVFCARCRGISAGWNGRQWASKFSKLLIITVVLATFMFTFPTSTEVAFSDLDPAQPPQPQVAQASFVPTENPAVRSIENLLMKYRVDPTHRTRIARAIVASCQKHNVDTRLVTGIMIVESRANPFAISESDSIGIMQIHLPTWGPTADSEGINLFKIEDNVDLGVRILKGYISQYGLWEGLRRYKGWTETSQSQQDATEYARKVQRIYGVDQPASQEVPQ